MKPNDICHVINRVDGVVDNTIDTIAAGVVTAVLIPVALSNVANESAVSPNVTFRLLQGTRFIRAFDTDTVSNQQTECIHVQ